MLEIEKIRETFSKGAVHTSSNKIAAVYAYRDRWFAQSFEGEEKTTLSDLLKKSCNVSAEFISGKYIKFCFIGSYSLDFSVNPPLVQELTIDELKNVINDVEIKDPYGLLKEIHDIGTEDEEAISEAIEKAIDKYCEKNKLEYIRFDAHDKWEQIKTTLVNIALKLHCEIDSEPPNNISNGYVEITLDHNCYIDYETIQKICDLINNVSCVHIDGSVLDNIAVITFFV